MKISVNDEIASGGAPMERQAASGLIQKSVAAATLVRDLLGDIAWHIQVIKIRFEKKRVPPVDEDVMYFRMITRASCASDLEVDFEASSDGNDSPHTMARNVLRAMKKAISDRIKDHNVKSNGLHPVLTILERIV